MAVAAIACTGAATPVHSASPRATTASPTSPAGRTSHTFAGTPTVGALFVPGAYPTIHTCTASVVDSRHRDVIVTAAHCMGGDGAGYVFAPGYHDGETPYGVWHVTSAYGAPGWIHQRKDSTQRDWAFLRVAAETVKGKVVRVQDVVGGNRLGVAPKAGTKVTVPGYPLGGPVGAGAKPITCRAPVYLHRGYPAFNCGGYADGVSGSPWLAGHGRTRTIVGIIGGLHQGGCLPATSYSSLLGRAAHQILKDAAHHRDARRFPSAPGDGC